MLTKAIPEVRAGRSPVHSLISGYPQVPPTAAGRRSWPTSSKLEILRARMLAIRNMPRDERNAAAGLAENPPADIGLDTTAIEIFRFVRDVLGDWSRTVQFIDGLPETIRSAYLREQRWRRATWGSHTE